MNLNHLFVEGKIVEFVDTDTDKSFIRFQLKHHGNEEIKIFYNSDQFKELCQKYLHYRYQYTLSVSTANYWSGIQPHFRYDLLNVLSVKTLAEYNVG